MPGVHVIPGSATKVLFNVAPLTSNTPYNSAFVINSVTSVGAGQFPVVTFSIPYTAGQNIKTSKYWTQTNATDGRVNARLSVGVAWNTGLYTNDGLPATDDGQFIRINALSSAAVATSTPGQFAVTSTVAMPDTVACTGSSCPGVTVMIYGGASSLTEKDASGNPVRVPLNAAVGYYSASKTRPTTGIPVTTKAESLVSLVSCNKCHKELTAHGTRTGSLEVCAACHNTEATYPGGERPAPVGKMELSVDFKVMIHGIHIGTFLIGGEAATYPMPLQNCQACHVDSPDAYFAPEAGSNGTTTKASATSAAENLRTTPWYATCGACHSPYPSPADAHMQQNGGGTGLTQAEIDALMSAPPPALKIK
jgi:OmcA/MtrC family decaheme c-type cytochrome